MDLKEVKKFLLEDTDGKKLLSELVEDHDALEGLKNKNNEVIQNNKKLKKERDDAKAAADKAEEALEDLKSNSDVNAAVEKATKKLQEENTALKEEKTGLSGRLEKVLVDNSLNDAITGANIAKSHIPAIRALIKSENKIEVDETDNVAKIGGKDLNTFVKEWSQGDVGKNYVAAQNNSGGGAGGSGGKSGGNGGSGEKDPMKLSPQERMKRGRAAKAQGK